jgi:gliding motility-associated-like protein
VLTSLGAVKKSSAVTGTVNPLPTVNVVSNQTVNNGAATAVINFAGTGNTFNWVNDTQGIGLAASGSGDISSFITVNTGNNPVIATITATPSSTSFAYIANERSNNVSVINTATDAVVSTIPVGSNPLWVSVSPDGSFVYVANYSSNTISAINSATNAVVATIPVGTNPIGVVVSPDGSKVYVANNGSNTISVINTATDAVTSTISVGSKPEGISVSPDGSLLYVVNGNDNNVSVINTFTNLIVTTIPVGLGPFGIAISPDGSRLYVANLVSHSVSVINTASNTVVSSFIINPDPEGLVLSPDGGLIYVTDATSKTVSVINTATNILVSAITISAGPEGISISQDGSKVYVTDRGSNFSVINTATNTVISTTTAGSYPESFGNFITSGTACHGSPVIFTITINPTAASPPIITASNAQGTISACAGTPSASPNIEQITVSGTSLTGNITAMAPPGFEVSLIAGSGYGNTITLTQSGGTVNSTIVYVRSAASASVGNISGNVVLTSVGATDKQMLVTGTVNPSLTINPVPNQTVNNSAATTAINFTGTANTFTWVNDTPGIGLAASGTGNISSFTAVNAGSGPITATITATPTPSSGNAYVANYISNNVSVINTTNNVVLSTIPVGTSPSGVSVSPDGSQVYITNQLSNTVSVINTATNAVTSTITVGNRPEGLAVSPDGSRVYVANSVDGTVSVINTPTNSVIATITVGSSPKGVCVSLDGSLVYVTNAVSNTVSVINTASNTLLSAIMVGSAPFGITMSPNGSTLYVANFSSNTVSVINTTTNNIISTISVGSNPSGVSVSPDGSEVYVANITDNTVSVINTTTNTVVSTIAVGTAPTGISVSSDGSKVYVTNQFSNNVSVINTATNKVIATIPVGNSPFSFGNFIIPGVSCSGMPVTFTITVNPTLSSPPTITLGTVTGSISGCAGMASVSPNIEQFIVSGSGLTGDIVATAPNNFEVSLAPGSGYGNSVTLTQSGGTVNSIVVYVRSAASASSGSISGNVVLTSAGATSQDVAVNGVINAQTTPSISIAALTNNICGGTPVTFTATLTNGGNAPAYQWLLNGNKTGTNSSIFSSSTLADGDAVSCILTSNSICAIPVNITSNSIIINVYPPPVVNAGGNKTIKEGGSTILNATATGNIADITWSPFIGLSSNKILNPTASPVSTTTYTLTVQTTDGCLGIDIVTVTVFIDLSIPNTFTPNGDGINDTWNVKYLDSYTNCTVDIYNRYGEKVYSSIGYGIPWNGTFKGAALPAGTYYYIIDLKNGGKVLSGFVAIIR